MSVRTGGICSIEDCPKPMFGKTWCGAHYATWRKHGDPLYPVRKYVRQGKACSAEGCVRPPKSGGLCIRHRHLMDRHGTTEDSRSRRFWAKVNKDGPTPEVRPELGPCWEWTGYVAPKTGYGQFGGHESGQTRLVHRIAYEYLIGPIPNGLWLDHLCKNRRCLNALSHLEPVTPRENIERGDQGAFWGYVPEPVPIKPQTSKPTTCTEPGCSRPVYKRTICRPCYKKWLKDPNVVRPRSLTPEQRFWAKVDKCGPVPEHRPELGPCWVWTASINRGTGYGQFGLSHGNMVQAHRYSYELAFGPIPEGYDVHHECHLRRCLRPDHLTATTRSENMAQRKVRRPPA